jgi:hypothetical protein
VNGPAAALNKPNHSITAREGEPLMNVHGTYEIDNRDSAQVYEYLEARIEVLKRRISELEKENHMLRVRSSDSLFRVPTGRDVRRTEDTMERVTRFAVWET